MARTGETRFIPDIRRETNAPLYRVDAEIQGYRSVALPALNANGQRDHVVTCHAREMQSLGTAGLGWLELGVVMIGTALSLVSRRPAAPMSDAVQGKLDEITARGGGNLSETARLFVLHEGRYQRTADALSIHVSTLRYRQGRLRDHFGMDLGDAQTRSSPRLEAATTL